MESDDFASFVCENFGADGFGVINGEDLAEPLWIVLGETMEIVGVIFPSWREIKDRPSTVFCEDWTKEAPCRWVCKGVLTEYQPNRVCSHV